METAYQERELHQRQAWCWWPLDTMAYSLDMDTSTGSSCSLFGWDPQLFYFGQAVAGIGASDSAAVERHEHELLVPKSMESLVSEASTTVTGSPEVQDAMAMRRELDELLRNLWDSEEEDFSSCGALIPLKETRGMSIQHEHSFDLGTVSPTVPTSSEKTPPPPTLAEPPSSSLSQGSGDARASDTSGAHCRAVGATRSSKRSAPKENGSSGGTESCKRSRAASSTAGAGSVLRPFAVVKPSAADGEVTLADVNEWILRPPARPVRHPVGEFACAPRVAAGNRPAPSGKTVAGFTRLHTRGRGTVTVVMTRG